MQVFKSLVFFIFYLLLLLNNTTYGQLKGNLVYNRLYPDEFSPGRSGVRITSIIPNFDFSWSGGEISKIENINGDWLITLRSGLQTLTISHTDFKSIDISLDLRNDWIQVYEIIPNIHQFYLSIKTYPDSSSIILRNVKNDQKVEGKSPFEFNPQPGEYALNISCFGYIPIDTIIVVDNKPKIELFFNLKEKLFVTAKKLPRIAVRLSKAPLEEKNKIEAYILDHYKNNDIKNTVNLLAREDNKNVFDLIDKGVSVDSLKKLNLVEFILDCDADMIGSLVYINMNLKILGECNKRSSPIHESGLVHNYFPQKVKEGLKKIDKIIRSCYSRIHYDIIFSGAALICWWLLEESVFKGEERTPLPGVPDFPKIPK